jgi:hypothetical protein
MKFSVQALLKLHNVLVLGAGVVSHSALHGSNSTVVHVAEH